MSVGREEHLAWNKADLMHLVGIGDHDRLPMLRRSHRPVPREESLLVCQSHDGLEWLIPSKCLAAIQRQFECPLISRADLDSTLWLANGDGHGKRTFALKGDRMDVLGSLASIDDADSQYVLNGNGRADYGRPPRGPTFRRR